MYVLLSHVATRLEIFLPLLNLMVGGKTPEIVIYYTNYIACIDFITSTLDETFPETDLLGKGPRKRVSPSKPAHLTDGYDMHIYICIQVSIGYFKAMGTKSTGDLVSNPRQNFKLQAVEMFFRNAVFIPFSLHEI